MNAPTALLFVYGTLKRGAANHARLADQRPLGEARLGPGFALYSLGEYPGLVREPGAAAGVRGEVWAVDAAALARLDAFEGVAEGLYARETVILAEAPPAVAGAEVQTYVYRRDLTGRPRLGDCW